MNDLLKKLNTLVKAGLNDLTPSLPKIERKPPDLDRQVTELRERINAALEHEDRLQATADTLRAEVERLDAEADKALANGQEALARHILEQMQRAQQRLTIAESELSAHQRAAYDLIQRVNLLEATVADSKAEQQAPAQPPPTDTSADQAESGIQRISGILRQTQERARERINTMNDIINNRAPEGNEGNERNEGSEETAKNSAPTPLQKPDAPSDKNDEDSSDNNDMARRLDRLSKK